MHDWLVPVYFLVSSLFFSLLSYFISHASLHSFHLRLACIVSHVLFLILFLKLCLFCVFFAHAPTSLNIHTCIYLFSSSLIITHSQIHSLSHMLFCSCPLMLPFSQAYSLMLPLSLLHSHSLPFAQSHSWSLPHVFFIFPSLSPTLLSFSYSPHILLCVSLCKTHPCPDSSLLLAHSSQTYSALFLRQKILFSYSASDQRLVTQNSSITRDNTAL